MTLQHLGSAILMVALGVNLALGALAFRPQPVLAATATPKVALIVGPVGALTSAYRSYANEAADVAERAGAEVVKVYSPKATWRAVKRATDGASIVVYLGHGNGWPSRYRDELYPPTQNGFGLNPVAGVDDRTHQYFGEASIEKLRLAPNAVVLLHHLCYASGNTEPGLDEGSRDDSIQRVDNYASGFLRAGARAVVAEAHLGPTYYVRALLRTELSIEQIWNRSPTAHGHTFAVASVRSPGYTARLDPDHARSGFHRSLVSAGLTAAALRASAVGRAGRSSERLPAEPSLASARLRFGTPSLRSMPVADTTTRLLLPMSKQAAKAVPKGVQVSVRWDPILVDPPLAPAHPAGSSTAEASPGPVLSSGPEGSPSPESATSPAPADEPTPVPSPSGEPSLNPSPDLAPAASDPAPTPEPLATSEPTPEPTATPEPVATSEPTPEPTATPEPVATSEPTPDLPPAVSDPAPTPEPLATPEPLVAAPDVRLVTPEQLGSVVSPVRVKATKAGLTLDVTYPSAPGLYRLVVILHAPSGEAYDAETQRLLTPMIVRVGGPITAAYGVPPYVAVLAGSTATIPVRVVNAGSEPWDVESVLRPDLDDAALLIWLSTSRIPARLVGVWVSIGTPGLSLPEPVSVTLRPAASAPGGNASVTLELTTPATPGPYLLLLDVVSPSYGPLSSLGGMPGLVRVTVAAASVSVSDPAVGTATGVP